MTPAFHAPLQCAGPLHPCPRAPRFHYNRIPSTALCRRVPLCRVDGVVCVPLRESCLPTNVCSVPRSLAMVFTTTSVARGPRTSERSGFSGHRGSVLFEIRYRVTAAFNTPAVERYFLFVARQGGLVHPVPLSHVPGDDLLELKRVSWWSPRQCTYLDLLHCVLALGVYRCDVR